jgi:protein-ribulosamine 3-kinase
MFNEIGDWLTKNNFGKIVANNNLKISKNSQVIKIETELGFDFVLKSNSGKIEDLIQKEVVSLNALRVENGPKIPIIFFSTANYYLMEYIFPSHNNTNDQIVFSRQLAHLHNQTNLSFGFEIDNMIGENVQSNQHEEDGITFFANHRIRYQGEMALKSKKLSNNYLIKLEKLISELSNLIPPQTPSLIHGDLWSGNILLDTSGGAALIDPATHFGWAEADLAMTTLFGGLSKNFYEGYLNIRPEVKGWESRAEVYNFYHLLNHLNIFGMMYLPAVTKTLNKFG